MHVYVMLNKLDFLQCNKSLYGRYYEVYIKDLLN